MKKILLITALASLSACGGSSGSGGDGNSQVLGTSPISLQNKQFSVSQSDFVTDCPRPAHSLFTSDDTSQLEQTGVYRTEIHEHGGLHVVCNKSLRGPHESSTFIFADNTYSTMVGSNKYANHNFHYQATATISDKATFDAALQSANVMNYTQKLNSSFELIEKKFLVKQDQHKRMEYRYNAVTHQYTTQIGIEATDSSSKMKLDNGVLIDKGEGTEIRIYKIQ